MAQENENTKKSNVITVGNTDLIDRVRKTTQELLSLPYEEQEKQIERINKENDIRQKRLNPRVVAALDRADEKATKNMQEYFDFVVREFYEENPDEARKLKTIHKKAEENFATSNPELDRLLAEVERDFGFVPKTQHA